MSYLPRSVRAMFAARQALDAMEAWGEAADRDAGFDAGEFSGPACGRAMERALVKICSRHRLLERDFLNTDLYIREVHGDDPMGDHHGRNE